MELTELEKKAQSIFRKTINSTCIYTDNSFSSKQNVYRKTYPFDSIIWNFFSHQIRRL